MAEQVNISKIMHEGAEFTGPNAPAPGDANVGEFMDMVSYLQRSTQPGQVATGRPGDLREGEFRFRTKTGYRDTAIKLRIYERSDDKVKDGENKQRFRNWASRKGLDLKDLEKWDEAVYKRTGEPYIKFRPVSDARVREATFATKDPFIAEYIRRRIAAGEFRDMIYEEVRPVEMVVNGVLGRFIPADSATREAVAFAQAEAQ